MFVVQCIFSKQRLCHGSKNPFAWIQIISANKKIALSYTKDRTKNSAVPPFFIAHAMHSAGCHHIPVFNADIRSGYSKRSFRLSLSGPFAVPLPTWFPATPCSLCVRLRFDFRIFGLCDWFVVPYYTPLNCFVKHFLKFFLLSACNGQ